MPTTTSSAAVPRSRPTTGSGATRPSCASRPRRRGPALAGARRPATGRAPTWPIALVAGLVGAALCGGVLALTGALSTEGRRARRREGRGHTGRVVPDGHAASGAWRRWPSGSARRSSASTVDHGRGHRAGLRRRVPRRRPAPHERPRVDRRHRDRGACCTTAGASRASWSAPTCPPTSRSCRSTPTTSRSRCSASSADLEVGRADHRHRLAERAEGEPVGDHRRRQRDRAARRRRGRVAARHDPDRRADRGRRGRAARWSTPPAP